MTSNNTSQGDKRESEIDPTLREIDKPAENGLKSFMNILEKGHTEAVHCSIIFYRNNMKYLITGSSGVKKDNINNGDDKTPNSSSGEFIVWNLMTGVLLYRFYGHTKSISALAILKYENSKDKSIDDYLITGSEDGTIIIWKYNNNHKTEMFDNIKELGDVHSRKSVTSLAVYHPADFFNKSDYLSNHLFVSVGLDTRAIVWNFDKIIESFQNKDQTNNTSERFQEGEFGKKSPNRDPKNDSHNANNSQSLSGFIKSNSIDKHPVAKHFNSKKFHYSDKDEKTERSIKSESNREASETNMKDEPFRCFKPFKPNKVQQGSPPKDKQDLTKEIYYHTDGLLSVAIYIPQCSKDHCVQLYDTCKCKQECKPLVITASWDKKIIIWDLLTRISLAELRGHTKGVQTIALFDPNFPVENTDKEEEGEISSKGESNGNNSPNFSWSSKYCGFSTKQEENKNISKKGSSPVIVSGSIDKTIIIWDLFGREKIRRLPLESLEKTSETRGHTSKINCISVFDHSPEQNCPKIASCCDDNNIIIWDLLSGQKVRTISCGNRIGNSSDKILSINTFVPSNQNYILVSCSTSKTDNIILWDFSIDRKTMSQQFCDESASAVTALVIHDPKSGNFPISIVAHITGKITIWNINDLTQNSGMKTTQPIKELGGHKERVNGIAVYPAPSDGQNSNSYNLYIASCDGNKVLILRKLRIWGKEVEELCIKQFQWNEFFISIYFVSVPISYGNNSIFLVKGGGPKVDSPMQLWKLDDLLSFKKTLVQEVELGPPACTFSKGHTNTVRCIISFESNRVNKNETSHTHVYLVTCSYDRTSIIWEIKSVDGRIECENIRTLEGGHTDYIFTVAVYNPENNFEHIKHPLIFTGSFDNKVIIWDSHSGKKLKELNEHSDSVTSLRIFAPTSTQTPLLVTTGIDKSIILWEINVEDVKKTKVLRKLFGHTDRVCSLDIYTTEDIKSSVIVSGSDDKSLIAWSDCLNLVRTMPTRDMAIRMFILDLEREESHWPLMKEMTKLYDISFWIENANLLFLACSCSDNEKKFTFFKLFFPMIRKTIRYTSKIPVVDENEDKTKFILTHQSLLRVAIYKGDVRVLQIILDCWVENLNQDIEDPLTQRLYHASYFVDSKDIFLLAKNHPSQFIKFIASIKLIKSSSILNKTYKTLIIYSNSRIAVSSCEFNWKTDLWKPIVESYFKGRRFDIRRLFQQNMQIEVERQVTAQYLPLVNAASREMLNVYVDISINENSVEIFKGDVGKVVLKYLWKHHARRSHMFQFLLYLLYVSLYSYSVYRFISLLYDYDRFWYIVAWFLESVLLTATCIYFLQELYQIYCEYRDFRDFNNRSIIMTINKAFNVFMTNPYRSVSQLLYSESIWRFFDCSKSMWFDGKFWITIRVHLSNIWNFNDVLIAVFVITGTVMRIVDNAKIVQVDNRPIYQPTNYPSYPSSTTTINTTFQYIDSNPIRCVYAIGTICVYFKILYFLRPFATCGPLVSMILQIASDIRYFVIILITIMCAFAQVFWILNEKSDSIFGSSIWHSYLYTFMYMLGQSVDPNQFSNSASFPLNVLILAVFMLFMIILMLNLLIALMNDSFSRVREKGLAQWRLEQGGIILDDSLITNTKVDPYIYVLKYTSDGSDLVTENETFDTDAKEVDLKKVMEYLEEYVEIKTANVPRKD